MVFKYNYRQCVWSTSPTWLPTLIVLIILCSYRCVWPGAVFSTRWCFYHSYTHDDSLQVGCGVGSNAPFSARPPRALFDNQKCFPKVAILHWRILISATHKTLELQRQKCSARHSITVVADLILILVLVLVLFINLIVVLSRLVVPTFGSHRSQIHVTWGTRLGPSGHQHQH